MPSVRGTSFISAAIVFIVSFATLVLGMQRDVSMYDEALILVGATRVLDGAMVHRDFYANYGPGQFYALAGLFKIFGISVLVERAWDTAIRAAIVVVSYLIVQRAGSPRAGLLAAVLVLTWMCVFGAYAFPIFPALLFALLGALGLIPLFEGRRSPALLIGSGICTGIVVLFRYDIGFFTFAALTAVIVIHMLSQPGDVRARLPGLLRIVALYWLGIAVVCVPVAVIYVATGTLSDFFFQVVSFPGRFYRKTRGMPFPTIAELFADPTKLAVFVPISALLASLCVVLFDRHATRVPVARRWAMLLLGLLTAIFYLKGVVRVSVIHMSLSIIPALLLSAMLLPSIWSAARTGRSRIAMLAVWAGAIMIAIPTAQAIILNIRASQRTAAWLTHAATWTQATATTPANLAPCRPAPGFERVACFAIDQAQADAVRDVIAATGPQDAIFVGLGRHDRTFANDILFYFVAARTPATKWYHFDPGMQTSAPIQEKMIADMVAARPPYVVRETKFDGMIEPNDSAISSGVTLLDDFINAGYAPIKTYGDTTIYRRKD